MARKGRTSEELANMVTTKMTRTIAGPVVISAEDVPNITRGVVS